MTCRPLALLTLLIVPSIAVGQSTVQFSDDFGNGVIDAPLTVGKYVQEEFGTFADLSELEVDEAGGRLSIHGTGQIDTAILEGHGVGWIGSSAYVPIVSLSGGVVAVEAKLELETAVLAHGSGGDSGYLAGVFLEAAPGDRLDFFLIENITGSRLQCVVDVGSQFGLPEASFSIDRHRVYTFRLELNLATQQFRGLVDGVMKIQGQYFGNPEIARAGVMAGVRYIGDQLDARFDDLSVAYVPKEPEGARRTIVTHYEGEGAVADVTIAIDVAGTASLVREQIDSGWTVSQVSDGGVAGDGIVWTNVTGRTLSYRLSRSDPYFESQATITGRLEVGGTGYAIGGDAVIAGSANPYVPEVLLTPSFSIGGNLDGCSVRPGNVNGAWIGECIGVQDANIIPYEGLSFRPAFGTEWSQASGLDPSMPMSARNRFWSNPDDPDRSSAVLAKVRGIDGSFDWQGPGAFNANLEDTMCVAFFYVEVPGDQPVTAHVGMGSDDSSGIRVNGQPVVVEIGCGGPACFTGKHALPLLLGKNLISFYTFENYGGYNACIRFEDASGQPVPMRTTLDPTGYVPPGGAPPEGEVLDHDCNGNCRADATDIQEGFSADRQGNGIPDECEPPWFDCNKNDLADRDDIAEGRSTDIDANGIPDECEESLSIEPSTPYCVAVVLDTKRSTLGGELALAYDASKLEAVCPTAGADLVSGSSTIFCNLEPNIACDLPAGSDRALVVGWVNGGVGESLPPGRHEVLRLCFLPTPEAGTGRVCAPIVFTDCVGLPGAPVLNGVTDDSNHSIRLTTFGGEVCGEEKPFRRGDVNFDAVFDISDAITLLRCQFVDGPCPSCLDAADFNDDGRINISDPSYLLNWRFLGGAPPPPPFPDCGMDETRDSIRGCVGSGC